MHDEKIGVRRTDLRTNGVQAIRQYQREWSLFAALIVLAIVFGLTNGNFLTIENGFNILNQSTVILLISLGMTVVIVSGGIDLSVGATASLVGVITVLLINEQGMPGYAAIIAGIAAGGIVGLINGVVVTGLKIPDFIGTLAMMSVCRGAAFIISGGFAVRTENRMLISLYNDKWGAFALPILFTAVVAVVIFLILTYTRPGRSMYAAGGNRNAALLSGIRVKRTVLLAYTICGVLTAIAGVLTASRTAAGSPTVGTGWELAAVSIVILGGANLFGGQGGVMGTALAGIILSMINNWLSLTGTAWWLQGFVQGALLIVVVALNRQMIAKKINGVLK